jgi:hypothetical protein
MIEFLKPTVPKCVGAILLAAAQYYGSGLVFAVGIAAKVLAEPERWMRLGDNLRNCGINVEDFGQEYAQSFAWFTILFDLVVGYLVVAIVAEWTLRRRNRATRQDAL